MAEIKYSFETATKFIVDSVSFVFIEEFGYLMNKSKSWYTDNIGINFRYAVPETSDTEHSHIFRHGHGIT